MSNALPLVIALVLVAVNGFFVAAEFAFVKLRPHRVAELAEQGGILSNSVRWLFSRLDSALAACQLGITMASLGLGWVGEPAFAALLEPAFRGMGMESEALLHGIAFAVGFSTITALHLVVGEQFPKIFALRRPEILAMWCALPLRAFFVLSYPLLVLLNSSTSLLLKTFGIDALSGHDTPQSEQEIRMLLRQARAHGNLSGTEHRLLHAVFEFDDTIVRRIMVPRHEVEYLQTKHSVAQALAAVRQSRHTRYPVCAGSLEEVVGVVHLRDLIAIDDPENVSVRDIVRPPRYVPEPMPISQLLRHFQATHQHLAFVVDEHGTVAGIATLEDVLEEIVGPVEDEFDVEQLEIVPQGHGEFLVLGRTQLTAVNKQTGLTLARDDVDTISGLIMTYLNRVPAVGDIVHLDGADAEVLELSGFRAARLRLRLERGEDRLGADEREESESNEEHPR